MKALFVIASVLWMLSAGVGCASGLPASESLIVSVQHVEVGVTPGTKKPYMLVNALGASGAHIDMVFGGFDSDAAFPENLVQEARPLKSSWTPGISTCFNLTSGFAWVRVSGGETEARPGDRKEPLAAAAVAMPWRLILGTRVSGGASGTDLVMLVGTSTKTGTEVALERIYRPAQKDGGAVRLDLQDSVYREITADNKYIELEFINGAPTVSDVYDASGPGHAEFLAMVEKFRQEVWPD